MNATQAIETLDSPIGFLNSRINALANECHDISVEWDGLKNAGGARDDHAATLLLRVRQRLADVQGVCYVMNQNLTLVIRNPSDKGETK